MKAATVLAVAVMATALSVSSAEKAVLSGLIRPNAAKGITLSTPDFVVSKGSRACLIAPDWSEVFLRSVPTPTRPPITVKKLADGYVEAIAPAKSAGMVSIQEYSVRCQENCARVALKVTAPRGGKPVELEHVAFVLPASLLEGASYETADDAGKVRKGVVPRVQKDKSKRGFLPAFRRATFRGELGTVTIEVTKGPQVILDDRRSAIFEGHGPAFIAWAGNIPVSATGYAEHELTLTFAYPESKTGRTVSVPVAAGEPLRRAGETAADFPLLPVPASMRENGESFRPAAGAALTLVNGTPLLQSHAERLAREWNMAVVASGEKADGADGIQLVVGNRPEDESYALDCTAAGIRIEAAGERAGFYALQTLRGLYRGGAFRGVSIQDRPAFRIRAVHAMADSDTREHLTEFITKVMAPLKINTLLLECPYVKWEATKGMYRAESMEKSDLVELLKVAKENYIKVYPLIPTYSHSEWFFQNGHNREMIDNPRDTTAYNSLHPGVYPFLTKLFDEVLETFGNPEFFHISHDELSREHPQRPEGKKVGIRTLFKNDVMWHYNFFKKRNVKLMLWHDMLVAKRETKGRPVANARGGTETLRKELPKDIRVCVWNYDGGTYPEVDAVSSDGLPILGAGWYSEGNLESLTETCLRHKAEGMIVTTWHWKVRSGGVLYTQYAQMHSYVRAGALFWNPADTAGMNPPEVLVDLLRKPAEERGMLQGIPFTANTPISQELTDFSSLSGDCVTTGEKVQFRLARDENRNLAGLCVNSRRMPQLPAKVRIPLKKEYRRIHLLHVLFNRGTRQDNTAVKLVFRYADGSYEAVYLRNGTDVAYGAVPIFRNDNGQTTYRPDEVATLFDVPSFQRNQYNCVAWNAPDGTPRRVWSYTWENPHPDKPLDHLLIEAKDANTTYCLLGLTGENW